MKYYSEKTRKFYNTIEDANKAETEYDKIQQEKINKLKEEEEKKKKLANDRSARAKEIEEAIKARDAAEEKLDQLVNKFVEDYGSWHYTLRRTMNEDGLIDSIFKWW